jgi:hypothetical protein
MNKVLLLLLFSLPAFAQSQRIVEMTWNPTQGALSYEIQVYKVVGGSENLFSTEKIQSTVWSKNLTPGDYAFQVRSLDYRGVAGPWGQKKFFKVSLPTVRQEAPAVNQGFDMIEEEETNITFVWEEVPEAEKYNLKIMAENGPVLYDENTSDTSLSIDFEQPGKYFWKVTALTGRDKTPSKVSFNKYFMVYPPRLPAPEVKFEVKDQFFSISWDKNKQGIKDKINIYRKEDGEWKKIYSQERKKINRVNLVKTKIPKGQYKLRLVEYDKNNRGSDPSVVFFDWDQQQISGVQNRNQPQPNQGGGGQSSGKYADRHGKTPWYVTAGLSSIGFSYEGTITATDTLVTNQFTGNNIYASLSRQIKDKYIWENQFVMNQLVDNQSDWTNPNFRSTVLWPKTFKNYHFFTAGGGVAMTSLPYIDANVATDQVGSQTLSLLGIDTHFRYAYMISDFWQTGIDFRYTFHFAALDNPSEEALNLSSGNITQFFVNYMLTRNISATGFFGFNNQDLTLGPDTQSFFGQEFGLMLNIHL